MRDLISSEVWRDGGSLSAVISDGDSERSFWLQTNLWDHPSEKAHLSLFVSHGNQPDAKQAEVAQCSADEVRWLDYLQGASTDKADENSKLRFSQMIEILSARH